MYPLLVLWLSGPLAQQIAPTMDAGVTTFILTAGAGLSAAVVAIFTWFKGELAECKKDRKDLYAQIETMHQSLSDLREVVAGLTRKADIDDAKK